MELCSFGLKRSYLGYCNDGGPAAVRTRLAFATAAAAFSARSTPDVRRETVCSVRPYGPGDPSSLVAP